VQLGIVRKGVGAGITQLEDSSGFSVC
jgi:hypothetical protein